MRPPPFGTSAIRVSAPFEIEISVGGDASGASVNSRDDTSTGFPHATETEGAGSPRPAIQGVEDRSTRFSGLNCGRFPSQELAETNIGPGDGATCSMMPSKAGPGWGVTVPDSWARMAFGSVTRRAMSGSRSSD